MGEIGQVEERDGEFIKVRMPRQKACEKCRACATSLQGEFMQMRAQNACDADIGDWVSIDLDRGFFLRAVLIMYGAPMLTLLAGFWLGVNAAEALSLPLSEPIGFVSGITLAALTYFGISKFQAGIDRSKHTPIAVRKVDAPEQPKKPTDVVE